MDSRGSVHTLSASLVAEQDSFSIAGIAESLGFSDDAGMALTFIVGGALLMACIGIARRGNEALAFLFSIVAALALSPIVWLHYLVTLVVPIGILRPRFSVVWLLPIVLWVCPRDGNGEGLETYLPALVVIGDPRVACRTTARDAPSSARPDER